jgi:hypothetical protein
MKCGSKRRLKPTISLPFVSATTFMQARTRSTSRSIGFSQKIALPAREKRSIRSAWVSVGVQITTASMSLAVSIASMVAHVAAVLFGDRVGGGGEGIGDGDEHGVRVAGHGLGMHLADAAGTEKTKSYSHVFLV